MMNDGLGFPSSDSCQQVRRARRRHRRRRRCSCRSRSRHHCCCSTRLLLHPLCRRRRRRRRCCCSPRIMLHALRSRCCPCPAPPAPAPAPPARFTLWLRDRAGLQLPYRYVVDGLAGLAAKGNPLTGIITPFLLSFYCLSLSFHCQQAGRRLPFCCLPLSSFTSFLSAVLPLPSLARTVPDLAFPSVGRRLRDDVGRAVLCVLCDGAGHIVPATRPAYRADGAEVLQC